MKIRKAFVISVNPGAEEECEKRHNPIWPDLEKVLKDQGVSNYAIFLHSETRQLFGHVEIEKQGAIGVHLFHGRLPEMVEAHERHHGL